MTLHFKNIFTVSKTAYKEWMSKDPFRESAVIAYYSIFSLPGLLVVIVTCAGYFLGREAVNNHLTAQITGTLGAQTADQIHNIIVKASEAKNSLWAAIIGVVTIIVGATGVFAEFQKALNTIWQVKTDKSKSGLWHVIRVRLFSFGLIISIAFILIVSLVVSAMLSALGHWLSRHFADSFFITLQVVNSVASLIILAGLFALMFKFFPDAKIKWRHVWVGSLVAGSVILIMLWVSYSSMMVFYGAEFTHAYAGIYSGKAPPSEIANHAHRGNAITYPAET
jgi:membrane protein